MIVDVATTEDVRDGVARCVTAAHALGWVAQQIEQAGARVNDVRTAGVLLFGDGIDGTPVLRVLHARDGRDLPVVGVDVNAEAPGAEVLAGLLGLERDSEEYVSDDGRLRCVHWTGWAPQWHDVLVHVQVCAWEQVS